MSQGFAQKSPIVATIGDGPNLDAFSRLRISEPVTLFSSLSQYDNSPLIYESGNTGTGVAPAHDANTRMTAISCTAGSGTSFMQSYEYIPYQPGRSQLILMTGLLGAGVAAVTVDVGAFDADNGIFLRQNGVTNLQIVRRSKTSGSVVDTAVAQSSWNLDPLNGTGKSGITLDPATVFILVIDAQFLGMGRVRVGFDIGGVVVYCHEFRNANSLAVPYMQTLCLPIQMLVTATSSGSTKTAYFKCASVGSEGGFSDDIGYTFLTPEQTVTAGSATRTHILSIRPKTTFNSKTNRARFRLNAVAITVTGTNPILWELCIGSTFSAAPTWADVSTTYSAFESTATVGTLTAAGTAIAGGYVVGSNQQKESVNQTISSRYPISLDRAGAVRALGTMSLIVTGIGGTSACRAVLQFTEIR